MKLSELLNIVDFDFDFCDKDWDTCFYACPTAWNKYAKLIDVVSLDKDFCVCDFTKFINENKELILDKIYDYYIPAWATLYENAINNPKDYEDDYCYFIEHFVRDLLEEGEENE